MIKGKTKVTAEEVIRELGFILGLNQSIGWDEEGEDDFDTWYEAIREEAEKLSNKRKAMYEARTDKG